MLQADLAEAQQEQRREHELLQTAHAEAKAALDEALQGREMEKQLLSDKAALQASVQKQRHEQSARHHFVRTMPWAADAEHYPTGASMAADAAIQAASMTNAKGSSGRPQGLAQRRQL